MGFFSSLWGKNSENGKNTQNNTPTVQQPRMTEAQRHNAFVQSLRENTANGKYGPVPTQSTARKAAATTMAGAETFLRFSNRSPTGGLVCSVRQTCFNRKGETTMFESALGNLCIVICGMTVLLSAFFIWRTETLPNRLIVAAAAALVLIFRWQISMMIYQFVASIFTLVALFVGVVLLCALPFVLIRLFLH